MKIKLVEYPVGLTCLNRRKLQKGFLMDPIDTKLKIRKLSTPSYSELLNEMKAKVSAHSSKS